MKHTVNGILIVLALAALPVTATAQQMFDFNAQVVLPADVGGTLQMYSQVFDPYPATTPIPLDFAGYEFTMVIDGLVLVGDANPQAYSGGTLTIYQDDATSPDYGDLSTFTDGDAILVGTFVELNRIVFTPTMGSVQGTVDWIGGSRLDDIAPWDQDDWTFLAGANSSTFAGVLPGFDEVWDGKCEPKEPIVDAENDSWGSVKALFSR